MKNKMDAQIKKGILEMCLLKKLSQSDYYGYTLMQEMRKVFTDVNDSTFYAILRRLNKEGKTETYFGKESLGPKRKYYRITDFGIRDLNSSVRDWKELQNIVKQIGID